MYKVLVTVCMMQIPQNCMTLENHEYPEIYETYDQCKERALEIGSQVPVYMPKWKAIRWRCIKVKEGRFSNYQSKGE